MWISVSVLAIILLSYGAMMLITPYDQTWYLQTSLDRLLLQLWPGAVLLFCRLLPDDTAFGTRKDTEERTEGTEITGADEHRSSQHR